MDVFVCIYVCIERYVCKQRFYKCDCVSFYKQGQGQILCG